MLHSDYTSVKENKSEGGRILAQVSQRSYCIFTSRDTQNLAEHSSEPADVSGTAMSSELD